MSRSASGPYCSPVSVRRSTKSWMTSSGRPPATGRSELPGSTRPARSSRPAGYDSAARSGPIRSRTDPPNALMKFGWVAITTSSSAMRAT